MEEIKSPVFGRYLALYACRSRWQETRTMAHSGGTVSQIIMDALSNDLVFDAVLVEDYGLGARRKLCTTSEDVLACGGSKYSSVDETPESRDLAGPRRLQTVLPCQHPGLKSSIGLFCGYHASDDIVPELLRREGIAPLDATPSLVAELRRRYWWLQFYYTPKRCRHCTLFAADHADLSVGDAHRPGLGKPEYNLVVVRTPRGLELFQNARENLEVGDIHELAAIGLSGSMIHYKREKSKLGNLLHAIASNIPKPILRLIPDNLLKLYARIIRRAYHRKPKALYSSMSNNIPPKKHQTGEAKK